ncbi:TPA: cell envelope biogenesis protein TolA [Yersinia enterocolitica]
MAEEKKELALVTLPVEKIDLEVALLNDKFIDELIDNVRKTAGSVVGDLKTAKGRGVYITMADQVRKSKAAFEVRAKELVAELKARPALIDANRKKFRDELDNIAVAIRKPVTDWEAEQDRLKQEAEAKKAAEKLAAEIEVAHEMALLMNDAFDRDAKEKAEEVERLRKAHEEFIVQQAEEKAKREMAEAAQRDIDAAAARERDALLAKERAEREKQEASELAERNRIAAEQKAEQDRKDAAAKAEREKQEAIAAEQLKAQREAERVQREAKQKEEARIAEEKRIADEDAKRAADVEHRRTINRQAVADLIANGLPEDCAQKCVAAIAKNLISSVRITY